MKKRKAFFVLAIVFFSILIGFIIRKFDAFGIYERVYEIDTNYFESGDNDYIYDAIVTDDSITFYDSLGNSIIYTFEADRLTNVLNVYNAKSEAEAKRIATYFNKQIGKGEIERVTYKGTTVSVMMDINYFSEFKNYSKKEIESILMDSKKNND